MKRWRVALALLLPICAVCGGGGGGDATGPSPAPTPEASIVRGPYLQSAPEGSVTVAWYLDEPSVGRVQWGVAGGAVQEAASSAGSARRHEAVLQGLQAGTRYTYRVLGRQVALADVDGRSEFAFTSPRSDVFKMVVFGDSGSAEPPQHAVARQLAAESPLPDLVFVVGDVVYPSGGDADYDPRFFAPYRTLLQAVPFYAALGNHDYETESGRPWLEVFTLPRNGPAGLVPETAYFFERPGVQVLVHDSNVTAAELRAHALPWHAEQARRPAVFRLACLHHPPYASGPNAADPDSAVIRALFPPAFTASGVDVAFSGHEHFYERTVPMGGVVYVTVGTGGMELYARTARNAFTAVFDNTHHGYTRVEVEGRELRLRQIDTEGRVLDSLRIVKPVAATDTLSVAPGPAPAGFESPAFDDRGWTCVAPGAAAPGPPRRKLALRTRVALERAWQVSAAILRVRGGGAASAWLNGVEVGAWTGAATAFTVLELPPGRLRNGTNLLALEVTGGPEGLPRVPALELLLISEGPPESD